MRDSGLPVRDGKRPGTYLLEQFRADYGHALDLAREMAASSGLALNRRMRVESEFYELVPLANVRRGMTMLVRPFARLAVIVVPVPKMWKNGKCPGNVSASDMSPITSHCEAIATRFRCVSMTPLGKPVVPLEQRMTATSSHAAERY